jgi:superfamily II DNA helicase RecQ
VNSYVQSLLYRNHLLSPGKVSHTTLILCLQSLSFILAALAETKATLVVEPLNALILDQVKHIKSLGAVIDCEKLLTLEEARESGLLRASRRLNQIADSKSKLIRPLILVSTPELVNDEACLTALKAMAQQKKISRIVIDEFD